MKICMRTGAHWAWQLADVGQLRLSARGGWRVGVKNRENGE